MDDLNDRGGIFVQPNAADGKVGRDERQEKSLASLTRDFISIDFKLFAVPDFVGIADFL